MWDSYLEDEKWQITQVRIKLQTKENVPGKTKK
jgi:hypothetical protein